jgi:hypothetical protein
MSKSKEWVTTVYEALVADPKVQERVWKQLEDARTEDESSVLHMDVMAARRYLQTCLLAMSDAEVRHLTANDVAGLWARGAIGAANYRRRKK